MRVDHRDEISQALIAGAQIRLRIIGKVQSAFADVLQIDPKIRGEYRFGVVDDLPRHTLVPLLCIGGRRLPRSRRS
jgi:hypothetical protein